MNKKPKLVMVGRCERCGKEFCRPYPCDIAVCDCKSVRKIPLELAVKLPDALYDRIDRFAKEANVSPEALFEALLDAYLKKFARRLKIANQA